MPVLLAEDKKKHTCRHLYVINTELQAISSEGCYTNQSVCKGLTKVPAVMTNPSEALSTILCLTAAMPTLSFLYANELVDPMLLRKCNVSHRICCCTESL